MIKTFEQFSNGNYLNAISDEEKINRIKAALGKYQETPEYDEKGQFDLQFQDIKYPVGIYMYEDELFVLTGDGLDKEIDRFDAKTLAEIYKQVCKK